MEDHENSRPDIPGLVNKGRKGKKKANNTTSKSSLTLQTFLHDNNKEALEGSSSSGASYLVSDPMESHFAKLNLDDEVKKRAHFSFFFCSFNNKATALES